MVLVLLQAQVHLLEHLRARLPELAQVPHLAHLVPAERAPQEELVADSVTLHSPHAWPRPALLLLRAHVLTSRIQRLPRLFRAVQPPWVFLLQEPAEVALEAVLRAVLVLLVALAHRLHLRPQHPLHRLLTSAN